MINQLLKLGALIATGRFFKQRWRGVLAVLAVWLALWVIHGEFVQYVGLSGDTRYVLHASIAKLALYALSIAVYVWRVERPLWPKTPAPVAPPPSPNKIAATKTTGSRPVTLAQGDDGFDFLRRKK
ncbi:MAG: hypothetical protein SV422_14890 [Pseudomonadota bacterium]|nr:hypothetical protein [Pseudomonadota bacterium]